MATFETKISQLTLVHIAAAAARQYYPSRPYAPGELDRATGLLSYFLDKKERLGPDAYLVVQMELASLKLKKAEGLALAGGVAASSTVNGLLDDVKVALREGRAALDALPEGTHSSVPATVHRVAAEYHQARGPAAAYYDAALQYLALTPLAELEPAAAADAALQLAVSALVGEGVFSFAEVASHPVMAALTGTPHAWLLSLLKTFETGDIDGFNAALSAHGGAVAALPALTSHLPVLKEKIVLLAVMELAASRPAEARSLTFAELSSATRLPVDQVEWVLMRAMSLGLLKGAIDEVGACVNVSYVRPRVLTLPQIRALKDRVEDWAAKAAKFALVLEEGTRELLA